MTYYLSADSAFGTCSVALCKGGVVVAEREETSPSRQAERLVPLIEEVLKEVSIGYDALTALVSTTGPGSFTGVRIAMAAIKGIALATSLPTIGVNTLETVAFGHSGNGTSRITACLNAMRGEVSVQTFQQEADGNLTPINDPQMIVCEALAPLTPEATGTLVGNAQAIIQEYAPQLVPVLSQEPALPRARDAARLAWLRYGAAPKAMKLEPLYLRKPDAKPQPMTSILDT